MQQGYCQEKIQQEFPKILAHTLNKVPLAIPKDLTQMVNIVILVFERQAQSKVNTWTEMILSKMEPQDQISYLLYSTIHRRMKAFDLLFPPLAYYFPLLRTP